MEDAGELGESSLELPDPGLGAVHRGLHLVPESEHQPLDCGGRDRGLAAPQVTSPGVHITRDGQQSPGGGLAPPQAAGALDAAPVGGKLSGVTAPDY